MKRVVGRIPRDPLLFFLIAVAIRIAFLMDVAGDPWFSMLAVDAESYDGLARQFASGDVLFGDEPLWFAPLYPTLLGAIWAIFGPSPLIARLLQLLLGAFTAAIGVRLGARVSPGVGRIAGGFLALSPVLFFYENQLLYTSLAVFLVAAFLETFLSAVDRGGMRRTLLSGAVLGAAGLVRSNTLLFLPVGAFWLARRRGIRAGIAFAIAGATLLLPVLLRNGVVAGAWTPMTVNGGMIFATGFAEDSVGGRALLRSPRDFGPGGAWHRDAERMAGHPVTLAEASELHRQIALERIRRDPGWALGLTGEKIALLANAREIDDNLGFAMVRDRTWTLSWWPRPWAALIILASIGGVGWWAGTRRRTHSPVAVLFLFSAIYVASLLPFFVNARYRLPLVIPGAVLAGIGVMTMVEAVRRPRARRLAVLAVVSLVAGWATLRSPGVEAAPALEWVAVATGLERLGRHDEALEAIDIALAFDPSVPGAHHDRALTLHSLGRDAEALPSALEATRLDPGLFEAWMVRGAILATLGRVPEAIPAFRRAVELRPDDPAAQANLSQALALTEPGSGDAHQKTPQP